MVSASELGTDAIPTARNVFLDSSVMHTISPSLNSPENFVIPGRITLAPLHTNFTAPMSTMMRGNFPSAIVSVRNGTYVLPIFNAFRSSPAIYSTSSVI